MTKKVLLSVSLLMAGVSCIAAADKVSVVDRPDVSQYNSYYPSNKSPLQPQYFVKLPAGSVKPAGWMAEQLELQKDGLMGNLGEISAWLQKNGNAWLSKGGEFGWEEVPYWLRGYSMTAYILDDPKMLQEARFWIDSIIASQREDGYFGPETLRNGHLDLWSNMIACWIMQEYYEYSGDKRVIDFMTKYFKWVANYPDDKFLKDYWENSRGGDMMWSVVWLYNRTGDESLLALADKIHRNTADWTKSTQLPNWHNVNIAQGVREPATYWLFKKDGDLLRASYNVQSLIRRTFGQVPGGMFGADENARTGFFDPRQGTETCGFAEQMASDQIMLMITGDPYWAENSEDIAFNSFPAAFMPDYKALRYITSPNQTVSDSKNHKPGIDNGGPFLMMNPFSSRCCQHNHGLGWPYMANHLILATPDNGLAAVEYAACSAKAKVGDGTEITLTEESAYPFDDRIVFAISTGKPVVFPLYLRIPTWSVKPSVKVNGKKVAAKLEPGKYVRLEREWKDGDRVELTVPMEVTMRTWQVNKNSVSVDYGPLTLSLQIKERYVKKDSKETAIGDSRWQAGADASKWPSFEIYPDSPWNYALATDSEIKVEKRDLEEGVNPFTVASSPLVFKAKGRKVPSWTIDEYGLTGVLPYACDPRAEEVEEITLIPMGAARLRISAFPTTAVK